MVKMTTILGYANKYENIFYLHIILYKMIDFEKHKMYIIGLLLILIVGLYFLHTWHVKKLIGEELQKIARKTHKKRAKRLRQVQRPDEQSDQHDMDSYVEPPNDGDEEQPRNLSPKLSKDDMLMRDMMDGSHSM